MEVIHERKEKFENEINEIRSKIGKKKLVFKPKVEQKTIKVNKTDPESGYYCRDEKEKGFMYCDYRTVDGLHNVILDTYITLGNVHDSVPWIGYN